MSYDYDAHEDIGYRKSRYKTKRVYTRKRRRKKRGYTSEERQEIYKSAVATGQGGFFCIYCKHKLSGASDPLLEADHVIPVKRGGSDELKNYVLACKPCNRAKFDHTPKTLREKQGKKYTDIANTIESILHSRAETLEDRWNVQEYFETGYFFECCEYKKIPVEDLQTYIETGKLPPQ